MKGDSGITHIAVYPVGGFGGTIASRTLPQGAQLTVISRKYSGLLREYGVGSYGAMPSHWKASKDLEVHRSLSEINKPIHWLLLPAPAYAMEQISRDISECPAINENTSVLLLNNGWLDHNPIAKVMPLRRLYNAVSMVGCIRRSPNVMEVTVNAGITIGSLTGAPLDSAQGLANALSDGGLTSRLTNQIGSEIFRKLSFSNACAFSALHRMPVGGLLMPEFTSTVKRIAVETWQASTDAGHRSFDTETAAIEDVFSRIRTAEHHIASITKALWSGQKTEIESLCGAVVRISLAHGWFAEECALVLDEIRDAEERNRAQDVATPNPELVGATS